MLELRRRYESVWDPALKPVGHGDFSPEGFDSWWQRNAARLANLHPQIAEQWVFRHWQWSPFRFIRLDCLSWRSEVWTSAQVLDQVHMEFGGPMNPVHDYEVMHEETTGPTRTARYWRAGTWNIPLTVLETPEGFIGHEGEFPAIRFVLVEGTLRLRYLNALVRRGVGTGPHEVYILSSRDLAK
jgi:hypothetical protein